MSQDGTSALQPGQQSKIPSQKEKKEKKRNEQSSYLSSASVLRQSSYCEAVMNSRRKDEAAGASCRDAGWVLSNVGQSGNASL